METVSFIGIEDKLPNLISSLPGRNAFSPRHFASK